MAPETGKIVPAASAGEDSALFGRIWVARGSALPMAGVGARGSALRIDANWLTRM
jgi:hypothetical protein